MDSTIRAIAGSRGQVADEQQPAGARRHREGALGLGDRHRVADAVAGRPLGDQPVVVHDHVEHQLAVRERADGVVAGLELPRHDQRRPTRRAPRWRRTRPVRGRRAPAGRGATTAARDAARRRGTALPGCSPAKASRGRPLPPNRGRGPAGPRPAGSRAGPAAPAAGCDASASRPARISVWIRVSSKTSRCACDPPYRTNPRSWRSSRSLAAAWSPSTYAASPSARSGSSSALPGAVKPPAFAAKRRSPSASSAVARPSATCTPMNVNGTSRAAARRTPATATSAGSAPCAHQAVQLAAPEHRGAVDQPAGAGAAGAVPVALERGVLVAQGEVVQRRVPDQVAAEVGRLVGARQPAVEPAGARRVVAALEEDVGHRVAAGEPRRVQLEGPRGQAVRLVELAPVLRQHRAEPEQLRVLADRGLGVQATLEGRARRVRVGGHQGQEDRHLEPEQVAGEAVVVALPRRPGRPACPGWPG